MANSSKALDTYEQLRGLKVELGSLRSRQDRLNREIRERSEELSRLFAREVDIAKDVERLMNELGLEGPLDG